MTMKQFINNLFKTTLSKFSPTPPKDENKGKGITTKENPLKELIPLIEQGGPDPEMINLQQFSISKLEAQAAQLAAYEAKRAKMIKEYNHLNGLKYMAWLPSQRASQMIFYSKIESKISMGQTQAVKFGIPPPLKLTASRLSAIEKKRKRSSDIIKEVFVKEDIVVEGMHRNLVPPSRVEGSRGLVISEPESGIFFYNRIFDLVFQREEEFHLAITTYLIRIQNAIQGDTP
ncbi:hypothetical protein Tco_0432324 [Tanacetum coccineum]